MAKSQNGTCNIRIRIQYKYGYTAIIRIYGSISDFNIWSCPTLQMQQAGLRSHWQAMWMLLGRKILNTLPPPAAVAAAAGTKMVLGTMYAIAESQQANSVH